MPGKRRPVFSAHAITGNSGGRSATKETEMSIIRIAVDNHLRKNKSLSMRDLLKTAYMKAFQKEMPEKSLSQDEARWNAGDSNIPYLLDFMLSHHSAH